MPRGPEQYGNTECQPLPGGTLGAGLEAEGQILGDDEDVYAGIEGRSQGLLRADNKINPQAKG